jgi:hypothetical protein
VPKISLAVYRVFTGVFAYCEFIVKKKSKTGCGKISCEYYVPPCQTQNGANRDVNDRKLFSEFYLFYRVAIQTEVRTMTRLFETKTAAKRKRKRTGNCSKK